MTLAVPNVDATLRESAERELAALQDRATPVAEYRAAMKRLGALLAEALARDVVKAGEQICLAMTVEDADFLGSGALEVLEGVGAAVSVACFWNERGDAFDLDWAEIAPIVQKYVEPHPAQVDHLIILKSIISGACVVRSNLEHLFDEIKPANVHVVAPVMLKGADQRLEKEFSRELASLFRYWTFEVDTKKDQDGNVEPGIGGEVYGRLGFGTKVSKNTIIPDLVRKRTPAVA